MHLNNRTTTNFDCSEVDIQSSINTVLRGDCIDIMRRRDTESVNLILTDPPYLANFCSRDGRTVMNDIDDRWLKPAFAEAHRLLRRNSFCISFYGWAHTDKFMAAWRAAGFKIVGHLVFRKKYASSVRLLRYHHEQAYLLAKGSPKQPASPIADVIDFRYTGNRLHPTEKPVSALLPMIEAFSNEGDFVLDPFCGSGSTLIAAHQLRRRFLGIELDLKYHAVAVNRIRQEGA